MHNVITVLVCEHNQGKIMQQSFKNQKKPLERKTGYFQKDPTVTTIYVGNLRYKRDEKDIKKMFEQFGKVAYAKLVIDEKTQKSKGIAFVQMPNKTAALKAINSLNGKQVDGRTLKVSVALERGQSVASSMNKKSDQEIIETARPKSRRPRGLKVLFDYKKGK